MKTQLLLIILFLSTVLFLNTGCNDTPIENIYNTYIVSDSLDNPNVKPRVVFTNPADGAIGPFYLLDPTREYYYSSPIVIQFNKNLILGNYGENPISVKSGNEEFFIYQNNYYSQIDNTLLFQINQPYLAGKTYTLTIDTTLRDINRNKLTQPYQASFIPEPKFRLLHIEPTGSNVIIDWQESLGLVFNSSIDSSIFNSISISPNLPGAWSINSYGLRDQIYLTYHFADTLKTNKTYTVSIAADAKDKNGLVIDRAYQYSFTTEPFRIVNVGYIDEIGPGGFRIYSDLYFRFNAEVNPSTLSNSITISPSITHTITYPDNGDKTRLKIHFAATEFQRNTEYKIHFNSSIISKDGDELEEYEFTFRTGK